MMPVLRNIQGEQLTETFRSAIKPAQVESPRLFPDVQERRKSARSIGSFKKRAGKNNLISVPEI